MAAPPSPSPTLELTRPPTLIDEEKQTAYGVAGKAAEPVATVPETSFPPDGGLRAWLVVVGVSPSADPRASDALSYHAANARVLALGSAQ